VIWRNHLFRLLTSELSNYSYRIYGPRRSLRYVIERLAAARKEAGLELSPDLKRIRTRLIGRCVSSPGHRKNSGCLPPWSGRGETAVTRWMAVEVCTSHWMPLPDKLNAQGLKLPGKGLSAPQR
jgi:hypothetical protein